MEYTSKFEMTTQNWTRWEVEPIPEGEAWWFERVDPIFWYWFQDTYWWWVPSLIVVLYLGTVIILKQFMENRKPFLNLSEFMIVQYLCAFLFSVAYAYRMMPHFLNSLAQPDWIYRCLCVRNGPISFEFFWVVAFNFSKVFHLLDTFFIILQKKPLSLFHLFHHSIMVLLPASTTHFGEPLMYFMGLVNVLQHSITYPYLACKAMKLKLPRGTSLFILIVELLQMILGLSCTVYTLYILKNGGYCVRHPKSIAMFNFAFVSMFILILHLVVSHFKKGQDFVKKIN